MGQTGGCFLKIFTKDPLGIGQANCFRTQNELIMSLLGKYPLAPSVNHEFGVQKRREEQGVSSGYDTTSESRLDPLLDYDEDEAGVDSILSGALAGEHPSACC